MAVLIEFLNEEPLDNVITCTNFKLDKVVYIGTKELISKEQKNLRRFLTDCCGVGEISFLDVDKNDIQNILSVLRGEMKRERELGNAIFFDITGGEELILVAFGMLSNEYGCSVHRFDVLTNQLMILGEKPEQSIQESLTAQNIQISLEDFIRLHGGAFDMRVHKKLKGTDGSLSREDVNSIFQIARENWSLWNPFSDFLRNNINPDSGLEVSLTAQAVLNMLAKSTSKLKSVKALNGILDQLEKAGMLLDVVHENGRYHFQFKNEAVRQCLWDGGSILELHVFYEEKAKSADAQVGIHIDWDGILHDSPKDDVRNEIDVLTLKDNIMTFISCKSGRMETRESREALYEIDTVARKCGGKYARKKLVTMQELPEVSRLRAIEMGIELQCEQ